MEPNNSDAYYHLADVHLKLSESANLAIDSLHRAIQRDTDQLDARFALGLLYAKNRYDRPAYRQKAINQFLELIASNRGITNF